jgi:hypothetical protein
MFLGGISFASCDGAHVETKASDFKELDHVNNWIGHDGAWNISILGGRAITNT